ncbi:unnamed protein product [Rotaria sp. Silwood1]|nr:unnamed protein product [Rotaria sp. Silwood1]
MENPFVRKLILKSDHPFERLLCDDEIIPRLSIQRDATVGSLYDARIDSIIDQISISEDLKSKPIKYDSVYCQVLKGNELQPENLLHEIGFDYDLWLSLLLGIVAAQGITSLTDTTFNIDENTRIIHYCYISQEQCIIDDLYRIRRKIRRAMIDEDTTHIIAGIRWGIHLLIVLQLSAENDITNLIDLIR